MSIKDSNWLVSPFVKVIIGIAALGCLAAVGVPFFLQSRSAWRQSSCITNLKVMEAAVQAYARDSRKNRGESLQLSDLEAYIHLTPKGTLPPCPAGGTYSVDIISNGPSCSIPGHVLQ